MRKGDKMFKAEISKDRLREARQKTGLSQDKARNLFTAQFYPISETPFEDYEKKADRFAGMKVETLAGLASLYDVSADYLLCLSDVKSVNADVKAVMELTGLSESTVQTLISFNSDNASSSDSLAANFINMLMSDKEAFAGVLEYFEESMIMQLKAEELIENTVLTDHQTELLPAEAYKIAAEHSAYDLSNQIYQLLKYSIENDYAYSLYQRKKIQKNAEKKDGD